MVEMSRATTSTEAAEVTMFVPLSCASTVEVMPLVVFDPAKPTAPPPAMPAAIDWTVPEAVARTASAPLARSVLSTTRAVTSPPMSLTDTAAPTAAPPEPLIVPAREKMSASLSAVTVNAPPVALWFRLRACAFTLAFTALVVKLPLTEAAPSAAPEAATDLISPRKSASTTTAGAADSVMAERVADTWLPTSLTAIAAPNAPDRPPETLPARVCTVAASSALTVRDVEAPVSEPPDQIAVMSSSSRLVVLEPVTAALPLTPTAMAIDSMVEVDKALTCTAPPELRLLLSTSAFTTLLLSALVAVRPRKLSAKAAPPAALPPPATEPAKDWMVELSRACTRSDEDAAACVTLLICASTVEVMLLVVLEPARAVVPAPDAPAATERMVPDERASTPTAPLARKVWF